MNIRPLVTAAHAWGTQWDWGQGDVWQFSALLRLPPWPHVWRSLSEHHRADCQERALPILVADGGVP